jgi:hypothetical protein
VSLRSSMNLLSRIRAWKAARNERRRLRRLLRSDIYGPALERLKASEQRQILDLISVGTSKQVRERLTELDAQRRQAVRERSQRRRQALKQAQTWKTAPGVKVTSSMVEARARMDRIMRTHSAFRTIDEWEVRARANASPEDLRTIANGPDDLVLDRGSEDAYAQQQGDLNYSAFWYHWS